MAMTADLIVYGRVFLPDQLDDLVPDNAHIRAFHPHKGPVHGFRELNA